MIMDKVILTDFFLFPRWGYWPYLTRVTFNEILVTFLFLRLLIIALMERAIMICVTSLKALAAFSSAGLCFAPVARYLSFRSDLLLHFEDPMVRGQLRTRRSRLDKFTNRLVNWPRNFNLWTFRARQESFFLLCETDIRSCCDNAPNFVLFVLREWVHHRWNPPS